MYLLTIEKPWLALELFLLPGARHRVLQRCNSCFGAHENSTKLVPLLSRTPAQLYRQTCDGTADTADSVSRPLSVQTGNQGGSDEQRQHGGPGDCGGVGCAGPLDLAQSVGGTKVQHTQRKESCAKELSASYNFKRLSSWAATPPMRPAKQRVNCRVGCCIEDLPDMFPEQLYRPSVIIPLTLNSSEDSQLFELLNVSAFVWQQPYLVGEAAILKQAELTTRLNVLYSCNSPASTCSIFFVGSGIPCRPRAQTGVDLSDGPAGPSPLTPPSAWRCLTASAPIRRCKNGRTGCSPGGEPCRDPPSPCQMSPLCEQAVCISMIRYL